MVTAAREGRWEDARAIHLKMLTIHQAMFIESSPTPVKTAASLMGKCEPHVRLPLVSLLPASLEKLKTIMKQYNLI